MIFQKRYHKNDFSKKDITKMIFSKKDFTKMIFQKKISQK
jgi:hypothetical protein